MNKTEKISVIIPTYNRIHGLKKTIDTLCNGNYIPEEIIVVDQSANALKNCQKIMEEISKKYDGNLIYEIMDTPSSTKARNKGSHVASNEIIVFMDDDVDVEKNTLKEVSKIMANSNYAMLGGIDNLAKPNGNIFPYIFKIRSWKLRHQGHVVSSMFGRYPTVIKQEVPTQWAMGYFFVIRKSLLEKWHIQFDEKLSQYAYAEDLDFTYTYYKHAKRENRKCVLTPTVKLSHLCSNEWRATNKRISYVTVFNRYYLEEKHYGTLCARAAFYWSNIGLLIKKIMQHDNIKDHIKAMLYCIKLHKDIGNGNLHTELYE